MHFVVQSGASAQTRLILGRCESGHPHLFGILQDFKYWCLSLSYEHRLHWFDGTFLAEAWLIIFQVYLNIYIYTYIV